MSELLLPTKHARASMAVFKTLIRPFLIRNPSPRSRLGFPGSEPFFSVPPPPSPLHSNLPSPPSYAALAVSPNPFSFVLQLTSSNSGLFPPLRGGWVPFSGPLFLSSPAWKLSQSATPLYWQGRETIFRRDLLHEGRFQIKLGFAAAGQSTRGVGDVIGWLQAPRHGREITRVRIDEPFLNLPNLISISRMLSGPLIAWMIINEWYLPSFCGLVISGATDWLDGFLARKMNINSVIGSYLDPLADKVLISCVALAMVEKGLLHPGLVGLVVLRDVALVGGAVYKRASSLGWEWKSWSHFINLDATHRERMEPLLISKVNTVFQLLLVAAALLQPEFGSEDTQLYITDLSWLVASTTVASAAAYGIQLLRK